MHPCTERPARAAHDAPIRGGVAALVVCALAATGPAPALARQAAPAGDEDVVSVDVRVVDPQGRPVPALEPDQFEVGIDGQRRTVRSARFVPAATEAGGAEPRTLVLVIDTSDFSAAESIGVLIAAQGLVDNTQPGDRVGVRTFPQGPQVEATTDRAAVRHALESVVGRDEATGGDPFTRTASVLGSVLPTLEDVPGKRIVVLVAPGMGANDRADVPPDSNALLNDVGQQAADAHAVVYTLFVDRDFIQMMLPHKPLEPGQPRVVPPRRKEDDTILQWFAQLSGRAGGALIRVSGVNPEPAFARLLDETSGCYELALEPAAADRDGRTHPLIVRVRQDDAIVRAPLWVRIPERAPPADLAADGEADVDPLPSTSVTLLDPLVEAYESGGYEEMHDLLVRSPDLPRVLRAVRGSAASWSDTPRLGALFGLEAAAAAIETGDGPALDEAVQLLVEQSDELPAATQDGDTFECAWHWAGLMLMEGAVHPEAAEPFVERSLARCPGESRIVLADAVLTDLRYPVVGPAIRTGAAAAAEAAAHQAALDRYEAARAFPDVEGEAMVREAWLLVRLKRFDEALALLGRLPAASGLVDPADLQGRLDRDVEFVGLFLRGQVMRERRDLDAAEADYRRALAISPEAQSVRVALMTLLASDGRRDEAERLAAEIAGTAADAADPWRGFWNGDLRLYPALIERLREMR